jgi:predicted RNase H-like nuclease (RuvC/YqgF family)
VLTLTDRMEPLDKQETLQGRGKQPEDKGVAEKATIVDYERKIEAEKATIADYERKIADYERKIADYERKIEAEKATIADYERKIEAEKAKAAEERDAEDIKAWRATIKRCDAEIQFLQSRRDLECKMAALTLGRPGAASIFFVTLV